MGNIIVKCAVKVWQKQENNMPYIPEYDRERFQMPLNLLCDFIETAGEMNYCISKLCHLVLQKKGLKYDNIAFVLAALEGAKLEFYRSVAAPYENKKMAENGDI